PVGPWNGSIVAGDFTGDGHLDLASLIVNAGTVSLTMGNGDGTFQSPIQFTTGMAFPYAIVAGDFNGDGHLDLAVAGDEFDPATNPSVGEVSIFLGNGDGTFQPPATYAVGQYPQSILAGDFTGDGRLDLAVAHSATSDATGPSEVAVLLGN